MHELDLIDISLVITAGILAVLAIAVGIRLTIHAVRRAREEVRARRLSRALANEASYRLDEVLVELAAVEAEWDVARRAQPRHQ